MSESINCNSETWLYGCADSNLEQLAKQWIIAHIVSH